MPTATIELGGNDITELVQETSVTHRFNLQLDEATVTVPSDLITGGENEALDISIDAVLDFSGIVQLIEDQGGPDELTTAFTAIEPAFIYAWRPCRDSDGDFSDPSFLEDFETGPQIWEHIFENTETFEGATGITLGTVDFGGTKLVGAPTNWPMTMAQMGALLCSTGELDIIHLPVAGGGATCDVYNGDYVGPGGGTFEYATGSNNCQMARRTWDAREIVNKKWDYLGPRKNQQQWWGGSITATHPALDDPPFDDWQPTIEAMITTSRSTYRERMAIEQFDQFSNASSETLAEEITAAAIAKPLYFRRWQMESYLRARPKVLVDITPDPGIAPTFKCGSFIDVEAGSKLRGGFSGSQRVMEYTYRVGTEGIVELGSPVGQAGVPAVTVSMSGERPA